MNLSLEFLERCSAETGFRVAALETVARMGEIAGDIARHPMLGNNLALKGGTALNLCFGSPSRLSVDLDFNYIGRESRDEMLAERPNVEDAVISLATKRGYRLQRSSQAFAGRKIYLSYKSALGPDDRIEIDLNFMFRVPISGTEIVQMWQPDELDQPQVRIVGMPELLIGKLLALLDRGAVRDVWDVAHLPQAAADIIRSPSFRLRFIAFSAILIHPLHTYTLSRLERTMTRQAVAEQLAPMLIDDLKLQESDLVAHAWAVLENLMRLEPNEADYVAAIERGEVRTDLLFSHDRAEALRIANHPAIQWKITNVRERLLRKR